MAREWHPRPREEGGIPCQPDGGPTDRSSAESLGFSAWKRDCSLAESGRTAKDCREFPLRAEKSWLSGCAGKAVDRGAQLRKQPGHTASSGIMGGARSHTSRHLGRAYKYCRYHCHHQQRIITVGRGALESPGRSWDLLLRDHGPPNCPPPAPFPGRLPHI